MSSSDDGFSPGRTWWIRRVLAAVGRTTRNRATFALTICALGFGVLREVPLRSSWRRPVRAEFRRMLREAVAGGLATTMGAAALIGIAMVYQALLWLGAEHGASKKVLVLGFAVIALAMLWNTGLAAYHAGVEWKLWAGPNECSGAPSSLSSAGNLLKSLQTIHIPRCDEAAWTFLGISLAGYDVPVSLALALIALWGAKTSLSRAT